MTLHRIAYNSELGGKIYTFCRLIIETNREKNKPCDRISVRLHWCETPVVVQVKPSPTRLNGVQLKCYVI